MPRVVAGISGSVVGVVATRITIVLCVVEDKAPTPLVVSGEDRTAPVTGLDGTGLLLTSVARAAGVVVVSDDGELNRVTFACFVARLRVPRPRRFFMDSPFGGMNEVDVVVVVVVEAKFGAGFGAVFGAKLGVGLGVGCMAVVMADAATAAASPAGDRRSRVSSRSASPATTGESEVPQPTPPIKLSGHIV